MNKQTNMALLLMVGILLTDKFVITVPDWSACIVYSIAIILFFMALQN